MQLCRFVRNGVSTASRKNAKFRPPPPLPKLAKKLIRSRIQPKITDGANFRRYDTTHEWILSRLFAQIDVDNNNEIALDDLRASFTQLSTELPSYSKVASLMVERLSQKSVDGAISKADVLQASSRAFSDSTVGATEVSVLLPRLERAVENSEKADLFEDVAVTLYPRNCPYLNVLEKLFHKLDDNMDSTVYLIALEDALDRIFSVHPGYYDVVASILRFLGDKDYRVQWKEWYVACVRALSESKLSSDSEELSRLNTRVDALDTLYVRRRARQRIISGASLFSPRLYESRFPKQAIPNVNSEDRERLGLDEFEACLSGYTIVDASFGVGSFARIFLARKNDTGDLQAIKRVDRREVQKAFSLTKEMTERIVEQEFQYLHHTDHPHVVSLRDFRQDTRYSYFVMEVANGGTLKEVVDQVYGSGVTHREGNPRKLSESFAAEVLHQTALALHDMHQDHRIHKDVKTENLMLANKRLPPHVLVIDLGFMEMLPRESDSAGPMPAGTPHYMAPEMIDTHLAAEAAGGFNERCDVYSLGIIAFELLTGRVPYVPPKIRGKPSQIDFVRLRKMIDSMNVTLPLKRFGRSDAAIDLLRKMLAVDPTQRPSAWECSRHPWMMEHLRRRRRRKARKAAPVYPPEGAQKEQEERRVALSAACELFVRRRVMQQSAAYHLVARLPEENMAEATKRLADITRDACDRVDHGEFTSLLMDMTGVDKPCAWHVTSSVRAEPESYYDFCKMCASLCADRAQAESVTL